MEVTTTKQKKPIKKDTNKETKETEIFEGLSNFPQFDGVIIDVQNWLTTMTGMKDTLDSYLSEKNHALWKFKIKHNKMLQQFDFWNKPYVQPTSLDPETQPSTKGMRSNYTIRIIRRKRCFI